MKNINKYILEKLYLNKDIERQLTSKSDIIDEINYIVTTCFENVSPHKIEKTWYSEQKTSTMIVKDTWFDHIEWEISDENKVKKKTKEIREKVKDILPPENVKYTKVGPNRFWIRIYLYDPE